MPLEKAFAYGDPGHEQSQNPHPEFDALIQVNPERRFPRGLMPGNLAKLV
jgi:hypothetical protein